MDSEDRGPELASLHVHPRQVDKAKRILREILSEDPELSDTVLNHVPFVPDHAVPLNWALGKDPAEQLVLTIRLKTRQVELIEA